MPLAGSNCFFLTCIGGLRDQFANVARAAGRLILRSGEASLPT